MIPLASFIYPASLVVFVVTLTLSLLYFAGMGQVRHFNESLSNAFGLSYHQSIFRLKTNPQKELDEKAAILGLSLFAGMIGITTTVGGAALEPPLSFVLIPATFDMLSLIVAFIEFPGTKVIMPLLYELRKIRQSLFTLLITLLWSMYLTTILWLFHEAAPFQLSRPLVNTVITVSWLLIALVVSSLINQLDLSRRNVFLITIASLLPLAITLML